MNRREFVAGAAAAVVALPAAAAVAYEMVGPAAADLVAELNLCREVLDGWQHRFTGMIVKSVDPVYKTVAPAGHIYTHDGHFMDVMSGDRHSAEVLGWTVRLEGQFEGHPVSTRPMAQWTTDDPEIMREMLGHKESGATLTFEVGFSQDAEHCDLAWGWGHAEEYEES